MGYWKYVFLEIICRVIQIVIVPLIIVPITISIVTGQDIIQLYIKLIGLLVKR